MKVRSLATLSLVLGMAAMTQPAAAQWYAGGSLGTASTSIDTSNSYTSATAFTLTKDERDTGYKLFGGYSLNENFALEGGYVNLGTTSFVKNVTALAAGVVNPQKKVDGLQFNAVGLLPFGNAFAMTGKVGTFYSRSSTSGSGGGVIAASSAKKSEWNWNYGLGLQYEISKAVAIRAELERFVNVGEPSPANSSCCTGENTYNLYSVGVSFKF